MSELHDLADRYAATFRAHVEATGGIEAMVIVERPGHPPTAVPAAFESVEEKERGLAVMRGAFQILGCTRVAWISEAWMAVASPEQGGLAPRERPDRTEGLMIVVEDATGAQATRTEAFAFVDGALRWGEIVRADRAERTLLVGEIPPELREEARRWAAGFGEPPPAPAPAPGILTRAARGLAGMLGRRP